MADNVQPPPMAPQQITPAVWNAWRLSLPNTNAGRQKILAMRLLLPLVKGIPADTVAAVQRRIPQVAKRSPTSYSYAEFEAIRARAAVVFNTAVVRIRENREHLRRWHDEQFAPDSKDGILGAALDHLVRTGEVPRNPGPGRYMSQRDRLALGGKDPACTWERLFLNSQEINAAIVSLVAIEGWNRSVVDTMRIPDFDPAAGEDAFDIYRVEITKPRRPSPMRYTTNNLVDSGAGSAGRVMSQLIEVTEPARVALRCLGTPTDQLLVWHRTSGGESISVGAPFACRIGAGEGIPTTVDLRRLRRTVQVLIRKEPTQNSQQTHESVYRLGDPATVAESESIVSQGLNHAVEHAHAHSRIRVMLGSDADALLELSDNPVLAEAVLRGDHDTATAACTDVTNSPHTAGGQPCTASFFLCLECPNAVATRRHLPRLVYLHKVLVELRFVVESVFWERDWQPHYLRLSALLDSYTTVPERTAALETLTGHDRELIDRLLERRLDP